MQHVPGLLSAVKHTVDERRVAESLTGRAVYFTLWPMTRREQLGLGTVGIWGALLQTPVRGWLDLVTAQEPGPEERQVAVRRGGYPRPALELQDDAAREQWFAGYAATYLERDVLQLAAIQALVEFRRTRLALVIWSGRSGGGTMRRGVGFK